MAPHLLYKPKWLPKWCIFPSLRYEFTVFFKYIQLDGHQQHVSSSSPANRMHTLMNKRMKEDERFLKTELDLVYCNWVLQLTAWITGLIRPLKTYSNQLNKSCKGQRKGLRRLVHNTFEMKYTNIQMHACVEAQMSLRAQCHTEMRATHTSVLMSQGSGVKASRHCDLFICF